MADRTARSYLETNVDPSLAAWREAPTEIWRASAAVHFAAALADWYIKEAMPTANPGSACEELYKRCPELKLLRVLDNSTKHMIYSRGPTIAAKVTSAPALDSVEDFDALDDFDELATVIVKNLETGEALPLRPALEAVVAFWHSLLGKP